MNKWAMLILPIMVGGVLWWTVTQPGTAIVEARVLSIREDLAGQAWFGGRYLSLINITKAYPTRTPMYSTRSECPLVVGQDIFVGVAVANGLGTKGPANANTTLYKGTGVWRDGGPIGFVRWNGCL